MSGVPKGSWDQFILTVLQWASVLTSLCLCFLNCKLRWAMPISWGYLTSVALGILLTVWLLSPEVGETPTASG